VSRLLSIILLLLLVSGSYLIRSENSSEPKDDEQIEEIEKWVMDPAMASYLREFERDFEHGLDKNRIPGAAVSIVKDGRVVYQKGFGVKEKGKPEAVNEHTVFRLGSVSKGFASVLAGVIKEEGLLMWDQPVSRYLDEFKLFDPEQTSRVQIRHLLSHTSGLPRHAFTNLVEDGLPMDRIIPQLSQVPLIAIEGEQIAYQNATYSVIEKVLEVQTETDFNTLLHEKLFKPLEMNHSSASFDSISSSANKASPHLFHSPSQGRVPVPISRKYYNAVSSGGINASASDMGKWLLLLTGYFPEVISEETLQDIYDPLATIHNRRYSRYWNGVNESHYGLGWRVLFNQEQKVVYHGGYVNGYRSEVAFAPDEGIGISVLINANSNYPLEVISGFFEHFSSDPESPEIFIK